MNASELKRMMDVCLPGTGGTVPLVNRYLTCCFLECQGKALLIDCGEGTQVALKAAGCKLNRLFALLFTHYHADHIAGLPGLLLTLGNHARTAPLTLIGPQGLHFAVSALMSIAPVLPFPLELLEWTDDAPHQITQDQMTIVSLPLRHSLPCLGYRISAVRRPHFIPERAKALSVPESMYRTLHEGSAVTLEDGRVITPDMVLGDERPPVSVCYITDTGPLDALVDFARDADLLISEGMHGDEALKTKMEEKGHLLFQDSARLARAAGAKRLWLTHYSPALSDPEEYIENARAIFPGAEAAYDGMRITLGKKPKESARG